jgi:threonylcarbamoyladenosine tRNA methylthiotransferase MtaB
VIVVNTCTVTHSADVDARRVLRGLKRDHPSARLLVTGCYAQRAPEELAQIEGVDWVVGNSHKTEIAAILGGMEYHGQICEGQIYERQIYAGPITRDFRATPVIDTREDRARPNLKVQDGCSNRCSFCIIPTVRGPSRSAAPESVIRQVSDLARNYREIVLSGINLGRWGRDLAGRWRFIDLVRAILRETDVAQLRLSSVEPMDWSEDLFQLIADEARMARHVHIPLQSGSDSVLKRMFRKYRTRHYATRLELAAKLIPDVAIGADVMTGFPGETDAEFAETVRFIETHPFSYLHVFTYSERPGTAAATAANPVRVNKRRERTQVLRELSQRKNLAFRRSLLGRSFRAVTLERLGMALTSNFVTVSMAHPRQPNEVLELTIGGLTDSGVSEQTPFRILA